MNCEHKELIHDYINIDKRIKQIEYRMDQREIEFNAQSFCGGTIFHPLGVMYAGFRVDERVSTYIDLMNTYKRNIAMNKRRRYYFNNFLNGLDPHTRASLKRRYKQNMRFDEMQSIGHDRIVLDEIVEIEDAISYEFGTSLSGELNKEILQVEYTKFSEETVEDSFEAMQKLLGV